MRKKRIKKTEDSSAAAAMQRLHKHLPKKRHDSSSELCLIVDGMNIAYQAYYAYARLSSKGKSTSIIFGMPSILKSIIGIYRASKIVVCWDGKKHPKRLKLLPEYKGHREQKRDPVQRKKFLNEIKRTRKLLHSMGVIQLHNSKVEGDDMIHFATEYYSKLYRVVIVSGDKDMYQLINWDVNVYNPRSKQIHAPFAFSAGGVELHQYVDYLCLVGDSSDDIPGYRGIGEVRACNFLRMFGSIQAYLDDEDAEFSGINDKDALKKVYRRNRKLIDLKYFAKRYYKKPMAELMKYYKGKSQPEYDHTTFTQLCNEYKLKTFLLPSFLKAFKI